MWPFSKSQPVAASGILCEMTDYHSHILPGVDDGVKTMNESLQILAEMKHQGVRKVWFTPPYHGGYTQYQRRAERTISRIEREIPEAGRCLLRYGGTESGR